MSYLPGINLPMTQTREKLIDELINQSCRPRNQIATLSGLTNTYIRNLQRGDIANVSRKKLIALGVALNLELNRFEDLLAAFDRTHLTTLDIPLFIEAANQCSLSEAVLAVKDLFCYELIMLAIENRPGSMVIVNDRPTTSLMYHGHRSYLDRKLLSTHAIYADLIETIGEGRRSNFAQRVEETTIEHCICRHCLDDYLHQCRNPQELYWRFHHVLALREVVKNQPHFHLYLTDVCANFNFTLKFGTEEGSSQDQLAYSARAPHDDRIKKIDRTAGFMTENPTLTETFHQEVQRIKKSSEPEFSDRSQQVIYLSNLLQSVIHQTDPELDADLVGEIVSLNLV